MKKTGKALKDFNDTKNNLKPYTEGKKFTAEESRYNELHRKGFVDEGKIIEEKEKK